MSTEQKNSQITDGQPLPDELLKELRGSIDNLDNALISILAERFKLTEEIGNIKAQHGISSIDSRREGIVEKNTTESAIRSQLDVDFAKKIMRVIVSEVVDRHENKKKSLTN